MKVNICDKIINLEIEHIEDIEFISNNSNIIEFSPINSNTYQTRVDNIFLLNKLLSRNKIKIIPGDGFREWATKFTPQDVIEIECGIHNATVYWKNTSKVVIENIWKQMSYFYKPAVNDWRYKQKKWDGMIRLYNKKTHTFPTGLVHMVEEYLTKINKRFIVYYNYEKRPTPCFDWEANDKVIPEEDQYTAIDSTDNLRGVLKAPTGFGKTAVLAVRTVAKFKVPSLFIANKKTLLDDAKNAFIGLIDNLDSTKVHQIKDGVFGDMKIKKDTTIDDIPDLDSHIIVATVQSLSTRLKDPRTSEKLRNWLQNECKMFMVDECQAMGTPQWDEVLNSCNAPLRFALSATPRRTDGGLLKIFAQTGETIYNTTAEEQIEKGRLCELDIQYHLFDQAIYNDNDSDIQYQEAYSEWIVNNERRNDFIVNQVKAMIAEERLSLLLINIIEHGFVLTEALVRAGIDRDDIRFVHGESSDKVRKEAIDDFRKGKYKVLIGSTIFDAGVNIPVISGVVIAGAGNSDITLIQKIGRGARTVDFEKELGYIPKFMIGQETKITRVIDIYDKNVKFFNKQAMNRFANASTEFGEDRVKIVGNTKEDEIFERLIQKSMTSKDAQKAQLDILNSFSLGNTVNKESVKVTPTSAQSSLLEIFKR